MTAFPSYSVGTVSVHRGDTAIVGAGGPLWTSTANARAGDDIIVAGHIWPLSDVIDATHLSIDPWSFDDMPAGTPYKILQRSPLRFAGGQAMADVSTLVAALNTEGFYVFVSPTVSVPDPSLGEESQFALQPSTGKLWLKTGGQWVFQGIFRSFNIRGAWDSVTNYGIGDVVSKDGTSYVASAPNTNQAPPDPAFWVVLAAKGDTGEPGASYTATSTTSLTIGMGPQTFVTQAGLAYLPGARARASNGVNYMEGLVTAYSGASLTINVTRTGGSGTFASWNINLAGDPGGGDMLSSNNLADVASKGAAFDNLAPTMTRGDLIARGATTNTRLAAGAAGFLLQSNGAGADLSYAGFQSALPAAPAIRPFASKLKDIADLRDWNGLDLTDSNDNATLVQDALTKTAATGDVLHVPPGKIALGSMISWPEGSQIVGAGQAGSIYSSKYSFFHLAHLGVGFEATGAVGARSMRGVNFVRSQPAPTAGWTPLAADFDIRVRGAQDVSIEDCRFFEPDEAVNADRGYDGRGCREQPDLSAQYQRPTSLSGV
jgi:hypothetical protein